jgi:hypothetical protein
MLASAAPDRPKGVMRASHRLFNAMDDERQLITARRLNKPQAAPGSPPQIPPA